MAWHRMALVVGALLVGCGPSMVEVRGSQTCDGVNLEACRQQCDEGVPRACYRLAWFYEVGHEVKKSPKTAVELYQKACDAGWAVACRALGNLYWFDETVDRQPKKAVTFYQRACELGIAAACPTEEMMAEAEGRKPRAGFSGDASFSIEGSAGSSGSSGADVSTPSSPSGPNAPSAPQAPTPAPPAAPQAPTPSVNPSL